MPITSGQNTTRSPGAGPVTDDGHDLERLAALTGDVAHSAPGTEQQRADQDRGPDPGVAEREQPDGRDRDDEREGDRRVPRLERRTGDPAEQQPERDGREGHRRLRPHPGVRAQVDLEVPAVPRRGEHPEGDEHRERPAGRVCVAPERRERERPTAERADRCTPGRAGVAHLEEERGHPRQRTRGTRPRPPPGCAGRPGDRHPRRATRRPPTSPR